MDKSDIVAIRHSLAHVLAAALKRLYGDEVKFGVGPAIDDGFYYDIDLGDRRLVNDDLPAIESTMRKIIKENQEFKADHKTIKEAIDWAKANNQPYKLELIDYFSKHGTTNIKDHEAEKSSNEMTFYSNGEFTDLCRGGHVSNTKEIPIKAFKLTKIAGAYWRGDEHNRMMQRIYGVAFLTVEELNSYQLKIAAAKKRDHRKLGKDLDLYLTSDLVGAGLPIFTPKGTVLREELAKLSNELRQELGFKKVWTPNITKKDLYEKSGHWDKFGDELFLVKSQETSDQFVMKPMNCPHHTRIYANRPRSYRDLPQRYLETTTDYRDEKSGELGGLSRVRALTQDDSHDFCRPDQIESEIAQLLSAVKKLYKIVDMKLRVRLSYRDNSDAYLGDQSLWDSAQKQLKNAVITAGLDYYEQTGEAAFYGPKIDFMATDALGREHQLATAQLDFVQPDRFNLEYNDEDGIAKRPVMIHCAILGSIERFLSVYIEHTAGNFPLWCAPEQVRLVSVKDVDEVNQLTNSLCETLRKANIRVESNTSNNSVGKKIRSAVKEKVPYIIVIGDKEVETQQFSVRIRDDLKSGESTAGVTYSTKDLIKAISKEVDERLNRSTLAS